MTVYTPREDSYLLKEYLKEQGLENKKALDMGTGSGIQALIMAEGGADVTAADINPEAVEYTRSIAEEKGLDIDVLRSDLFENVSGKFDVIVFNPPYLRGEEGLGDEEIWRGGETGTEAAENFLEQVDGYLKEAGEALVILSSDSKYSKLMEEHDLDVVDSKKLWFERLYLVRYK